MRGNRTSQVRTRERPEKTRPGRIAEPVVLDYWLGGGRLIEKPIKSEIIKVYYRN